jgi:predicted dehydrogenase
MSKEGPVAGVGLEGYAFMGKTHSLAWRTVSEMFWTPSSVSGRWLLGYEHTFTDEIYDFLAALGSGIAPAPSFADGLQVQRVLDAVTVSARTDSRMTSVSGG